MKLDVEDNIELLSELRKRVREHERSRGYVRESGTSPAARSTLAVSDLNDQQYQQWKALANCPLSQREFMQSAKSANDKTLHHLVLAGCNLKPGQETYLQEALTEIEKLVNSFGRIHSGRDDIREKVLQAVSKLPYGHLLLESMELGMDYETLKHVLCNNFKNAAPNHCN